MQPSEPAPSAVEPKPEANWSQRPWPWKPRRWRSRTRHSPWSQTRWRWSPFLSPKPTTPVAWRRPNHRRSRRSPSPRSNRPRPCRCSTQVESNQSRPSQWLSLRADRDRVSCHPPAWASLPMAIGFVPIAFEPTPAATSSSNRGVVRADGGALVADRQSCRAEGLGGVGSQKLALPTAVDLSPMTALNVPTELEPIADHAVDGADRFEPCRDAEADRAGRRSR